MENSCSHGKTFCSEASRCSNLVLGILRFKIALSRILRIFHGGWWWLVIGVKKSLSAWSSNLTAIGVIAPWKFRILHIAHIRSVSVGCSRGDTYQSFLGLSSMHEPVKVGYIKMGNPEQCTVKSGLHSTNVQLLAFFRNCRFICSIVSVFVMHHHCPDWDALLP